MPKVRIHDLLEGVERNPENPKVVESALDALQVAVENQLGKIAIRKVQEVIRLLSAATTGLDPDKVTELGKLRKKLDPALSIETGREGEVRKGSQLLGWRNLGAGGRLRAF